MHSMHCSTLSTFVMTVTVVFSSPIHPKSSNSAINHPDTRANLAQSIQSILNKPTTKPMLTVVTFPDVPQSAAAAIALEQQKQGHVNSPAVMTQIAIIQQIPIVPATSGDNNNLFTGLAQNVGQLNVEGIIQEAVKLAQISIGLFSQALASQLAMPGGSQLLVINNTTKLMANK